MLDVGGARVLARSGLLSPPRPDRLLGIALALARWRITPATGYAAGAARHPDRLALVDDEGPLTFRTLDRRTDRMAGELRALGVREGDAVGLLARNGRGFVESEVALAKCGADVLYLGTSTAPAQLREILDREGARLCVHDEEFAGAVPAGPTTEELGRLAGQPGPGAPLRVRRTARQVIMTSGTTGAPRGAARSGARPEDAVAILSRIPLRAREVTLIVAPVFHAWGLGMLNLTMVLGSTAVLQRRFDPERALQALQEHRATTLVVVPVLLDRILAADPSRYDTSSLRVIASSGGALPGDLVERTAAAFGPVLHSLYGSTEVAYAAVATPEDLAADPRTAGRPPHGVTVRVVDEQGADCPPGTAGRVFVGSGMSFGGYTDGTDKDRLGELVATGDLGRWDAAGRLTVLGRDDDMVVVGGENVFTGQVEDVLLGHDVVLDASVVGEPDPSYGARLVAHVVTSRPVEPHELQDLVRDRLARAAVPREIVFTAELPRNATGKVLKRELRQGGPAQGQGRST
ncbi:MAG TPA: AMP-binding protein [Mycobacteriales bacterium]|jgi:fatty-acyl-CoA synthase|nr:AMP-binding protein [Mycobacteriales bacterium]